VKFLQPAPSQQILSGQVGNGRFCQVALDRQGERRRIKLGPGFTNYESGGQEFESLRVRQGGAAFRQAYGTMILSQEKGKAAITEG